MAFQSELLAPPRFVNFLSDDPPVLGAASPASPFALDEPLPVPEEHVVIHEPGGLGLASVAQQPSATPLYITPLIPKTQCLPPDQQHRLLTIMATFLHDRRRTQVTELRQALDFLQRIPAGGHPRWDDYVGLVCQHTDPTIVDVLKYLDETRTWLQSVDDTGFARLYEAAQLGASSRSIPALPPSPDDEEGHFQTTGDGPTTTQTIDQEEFSDDQDQDTRQRRIDLHNPVERRRDRRPRRRRSIESETTAGAKKRRRMNAKSARWTTAEDEAVRHAFELFHVRNEDGSVNWATAVAALQRSPAAAAGRVRRLREHDRRSLVEATR